MPLQTVTVNELDGQIGVLPSGVRALAIVAPCDSGPLNTPAAFARTTDIVSNFGGGIGVEAACWHIQTKQLPVLFMRCAASTVSTFDTIDVSGMSGTSVATVNTGAVSDDDYEVYVLFVTGGTQGITGITYQTSLDGGRTLNPVQALGTAVNFTIPAGTSTIQINLGAGTVVAGSTIRVRFNGPSASAADLTTALAALKLSAIDWEICYIAGTITTTSQAAITTAFAGMPEKMWTGGVAMPTAAQTEATYSSTLATAWAAVADVKCVGLCAGAARYTSGVSGRNYAKPPATLYASMLASVQEHIDISDINLGAIPGTRISDVNGNPVSSGILLHDERNYPGLDDLRFVTLRTHDGRNGVRFTNPNVFSSAGSDFKYAQHRRVIAKLERLLRLYLELRLSVPIFVNATTGFILETEAQDIEAGANAACAALSGQVSGGGFNNGADFLKLSRTDNLLSTSTLNAQGGAVPLAYPKAIILNVGYKNPALRVQPVSGT